MVSINGVRTAGMTHSDAVELIQNSASPLRLLMRPTTTRVDHDQQLNHASGIYVHLGVPAAMLRGK